MQETRVHFVSQEDPLEKELATHSSILEKSHGQRILEGYSLWAHKRVGHDLATQQQQQTGLWEIDTCLPFVLPSISAFFLFLSFALVPTLCKVLLLLSDLSLSLSIMNLPVLQISIHLRAP